MVGSFVSISSLPPSLMPFREILDRIVSLMLKNVIPHLFPLQFALFQERFYVGSRSGSYRFWESVHLFAAAEPCVALQPQRRPLIDKMPLQLADRDPLKGTCRYLQIFYGDMELKRMIEETKKEVREIRSVESKAKWQMTREERREKLAETVAAQSELREWRWKQAQGLKELAAQQVQAARALDLKESKEFVEFKREAKLRTKEVELQHQQEVYVTRKADSAWQVEQAKANVEKEQALILEKVEDVHHLRQERRLSSETAKAAAAEERALQEHLQIANLARELAKEKAPAAGYHAHAVVDKLQGAVALGFGVWSFTVSRCLACRLRLSVEGRCNFGDACSFSHEVAFSPPPAIRIPQSQPPPQPGERDVCRHFLEGRCTYGDLCAFRHPAPAPAVDPSICRHFLEGKCNYGDACRFSHGGPAQVPVVVTTAPLPPKPKPMVPPTAVVPDDRPCRHFLEGRCTFGDACRFSHQVDVQQLEPPGEPTALADDRSICRHFLAGKCNYGDACRFSHGDGLVTGLAAELAPAVDDRFVGKPFQEGGSICRHFLEGKCNYGDACRFLHTGAPQAAQPQWPAAKVPETYGPVRTARSVPIVSPILESRVCRHFLAGKCTYGDQCTFLHPGSPVIKEAVTPPWKSPQGLLAPGQPRQICRHFLAGRCNYGSSCSFSHDIGTGAAA
ncbi:HUA1 [Symbiodinium natans]|uniref:HUA1 protein n=1 Tax=Symbiodinium natans TaxID=878477 RepID=A0A812RAF6_9DINO|nr:HUA1 [Symbiodinium natans]